MDGLVVNDLALVRELLLNILSGLKLDGEVVETSESFPRLSGRDNLSARAELRDSFPIISIIVVSARQEEARKAHEVERRGAIATSSGCEINLLAMRSAILGGTHVPPNHRPQDERVSSAGKPLTHRSPAEVGLTARQIEVLALVLQGKSNKAISRLLDLAEPTVKNHVTAILRALKVTNRTEAAITAKERGWALSAHSQEKRVKRSFGAVSDPGRTDDGSRQIAPG